jgi:iron(II)-dependent oxidoreductase
MEVRKEQLRKDLESVRKKTLGLLDYVPEEFLKRRVHNFYSPIGWHFGHIGRTEEFWISHKAMGRPVLDDHLSFLFADLPENPKDNRVHLPSREGIVDYLRKTRERTLVDLDNAELDPANPFTREGYAWDFALQHESQHQETICEMLQLINREIPDNRDLGQLDWPEPGEAEYVSIPGGTFAMGTDEVCVYDNEQRKHTVEVSPFRLSRTQVTVSQWLKFMREDGYRRHEYWSSEGWAWRSTENAEMPDYWRKCAGGYATVGCNGVRPMHPDEPVCSISWYEAEAFLVWAGKRFPTETELEYAASRSDSSERRYPWGPEPPNRTTAVFGIATWHPMPVGSKSCGASLDGVMDLAGNVWEWTSSPFLPYPGFEAFPYDGYSKDHMKGDHRVCRGGSWATAAPILRRTFRNWYVPTYRQGFLGLRCADD